MKKTTKKLSLGMKIASILACLALVSIGFASWWIVNYPKPVEYNEGSFEVYGVETKNIYFDNMAWGTGADDAAVIFGYPTNAQNNKGWFGYSKWTESNTSGVKEQDLSAVFSFTLKIDEDGEALNDYMDKITVSFAPTYESFNELVSEKQYIAAPVIEYSLNGGETWLEGATYAGGTTTFEIDADTMTGSYQDIQIKFTFNWGEYFNSDNGDNLNPYDFFNAMDYSVENAEEAQDVMEAIEALKNTSYKLTISSTPEGEATAPTEG